MKITPASVIAWSLIAGAPLAAQNGKPDAEGFIRDWLVLGSVPLTANSGSDELDTVHFPTEANPAARAGAAETIEGKAFVWKKVTTPEFHIDFKELYPDRGDYAIAWAVAYIISPAEKTGLTLRMNTNDQGKVYINGREMLKYLDTRALEKDAEDSRKGVTLKKGVNVLVLKVINEENNWQGSVRFLDPAGAPVTDLEVATQPPPRS